MITQHYKLNLIPDIVPVSVGVSQYDKTSRTIVFSIYNGDTLFTIPNGSLATVRGTKPDKTGFEYSCTISGSDISFEIQDQMTVLAGRFPVEIRITHNGELLGTANFMLNVEKSPLADDTIISETVLPLIEEASQAADRAEAAASEAETTLASAVKSVNNISPDNNGNVAIDVGVKKVNNVAPGSNGNVDVVSIIRNSGDIVLQTPDNIVLNTYSDVNINNDICIIDANMPHDTEPSSNYYGDGIYFFDENGTGGGNEAGFLRNMHLNDGLRGVFLEAKRTIDNSPYYSSIYAGIKNDKTRKIHLNSDVITGGNSAISSKPIALGKGQTISGNIYIAGYITSSGTQCSLTPILPFTIISNSANPILNITALKSSVRTVDGGYVLGRNYDVFNDNTVSISNGLSNGLLWIDLVKSAGFGITNNTPVVGMINITATIN